MKGDDEPVAATIARRRERVILATAGGASLRQIAAELGVSVGTVHEVSAELLAVRRRRQLRVAMMILLGLPSRMFGFGALCTLTRSRRPARCAKTPVGGCVAVPSTVAPGAAHDVRAFLTMSYAAAPKAR